jgi:hypothetical protein
MSASTDCKEYHASCAKVKEYITKYNFLSYFRMFDFASIVGVISNYIKELPQVQKDFKLQIVKEFSILTYHAWVGRREYRDKYRLLPLPGYEYQIQLMSELYQKSKMCYKQLTTITASSDAILPSSNTEKNGMEMETQFNIDDIELDDTETQLEDEKTEINVDMEPIVLKSYTPIQICEDKLLKQARDLAMLEALMYSSIQIQTMNILRMDICSIETKFLDENRRPKGDLKKRDELSRLWINSLLKKIYKSDKKWRQLVSQLISTIETLDPNKIYFNYEELRYIHGKVVELCYNKNKDVYGKFYSC